MINPGGRHDRWERKVIIIGKTDHKTKPIFSQRLAGYLLQRGFVLVDAVDNKDGSGRKVFFFNNSWEVQNAIGDYLAMKNIRE